MLAELKRLAELARMADRTAIAALLRDWEMSTVKRWGIDDFWRSSPSLLKAALAIETNVATDAHMDTFITEVNQDISMRHRFRVGRTERGECLRSPRHLARWDAGISRSGADIPRGCNLWGRQFRAGGRLKVQNATGCQHRTWGQCCGHVSHQEILIVRCLKDNLHWFSLKHRKLPLNSLGSAPCN